MAAIDLSTPVLLVLGLRTGPAAAVLLDMTAVIEFSVYPLDMADAHPMSRDAASTPVPGGKCRSNPGSLDFSRPGIGGHRCVPYEQNTSSRLPAA